MVFPAPRNPPRIIIFIKSPFYLTALTNATTFSNFALRGENYANLYKKGKNIIFAHGKDSIVIHNTSLEQVSNAIENLTEVYECWEKDLYTIIFEGGNLQDIVNLSEPIFKNPIFIVDELDVVCAKTSHGLGTVNEEWDYILNNGRMPFDKVSAIYRNRVFDKGGYQSEINYIPFLFNPPGMYHRGINFRIPAPLTNKFVGTFIIIENETPITVGKLHASRILAAVICEWVKIPQNNQKLRTTENLFTELLDGEEISADELNAQKSLMGLDEDSFVLAVVSAKDNKYINHIINFLENSVQGCHSFIYKDEVLCLCPLFNDIDNLVEVFGKIAKYNDVRIGLSYKFTDWKVLKSGYKQAKIALACSNKRVVMLDTFSAMEYVVSEIRTALHGSDILQPSLRILKNYDLKHNTEYFKTLHVFLQKERSLVETAKVLNIHRNSLIYRVERIKSVIGEDLDDANLREYILFSYRMMN